MAVEVAGGVVMLDAGVLGRAQGCLLGQVAGDALGQLVEFCSSDEIARRYPGGVRDLADGGAWNTMAGQPTDDSELALALARMLARERCYDTAAALDAYVHWIESGPFDVGATIGPPLRAAARAPNRGQRLSAAQRATNKTSKANGSLMRISPLGIFGAHRPDEVGAWAREDSAITHSNETCGLACAAFVAAIASAIRTGRSARAAYEAAIAEAARPGGIDEVRTALDRAARENVSDFSYQQGFVLVALQNAFYQLLHAPTLEEGVVDTVMRGGDTDTNAAIAGALLGAVHGRDAVPTRWRDAVLTCRATVAAGAAHPRPIEFWAVDAMELAETLVVAGRKG